MSATANDMAAYMRALLDPVAMQATGVLRADTAAVMRQPLAPKLPGVGAWRHGFVDYTERRGRPAFGHGGDTTFHHATMEIYPQAGIGVFVAVNTTSGVPLLAALPLGLMETFVGPPAATPPRSADAVAEARRVAGPYRALGISSTRTERALGRLVGAMQVTALADGDIRVGAARLYPIGGGVFAQAHGPGRLAFRADGRRMRFHDDIGSGGAERVGPFETPRWLMFVSGLAMLTAVWGTAAGARRLVRRQSAPAAGWLLDGLCLLWLAAGVLFLVAVFPWLADQSVTKFTYPGPLFPMACWALAAAAIATPAVALAVAGPLRPKSWGWWRWIRQVAAMAVFAALAATLLAWGFLGYSGW
jgi:hypothetical protein